MTLPARVQMVLPDGPPEETLATVAGGCPVVFSGRPVSTYGTVLADGSHASGIVGDQRCRKRIVRRHRHLRIHCNNASSFTNYSNTFKIVIVE